MASALAAGAAAAAADAAVAKVDAWAVVTSCVRSKHAVLCYTDMYNACSSCCSWCCLACCCGAAMHCACALCT